MTVEILYAGIALADALGHAPAGRRS